MTDLSREKFRECWQKTEIIREYERSLFTFADMELPYIFAAEHTQLQDRTIVREGVVVVRRPQIVLPGYYRGPEFSEGFEHAGSMPSEAVYVMRAMGLPYSQITNRPVAEERVEYGGLEGVLAQLEEDLEARENAETGLIKGLMEGPDVSLMRYALGLVIKSAPENVREYFEHVHRRRGEPIRPDEQVTDEDIRRLFER
jgi:hypothetical protein